MKDKDSKCQSIKAVKDSDTRTLGHSDTVVFQKSFSLTAAAGGEVTPEILARINSFALKPLTAEEVYVRKYIMAHNAVDRDNERFPEKMLDDFAASFPGKSFLIGHERGGPGKGLFFDALTEEMTPENFKALTGEDARLPDAVSQVKVLWSWIYMLRQFNEEMIANIDAGIYRHASIGFRAADIIPVKGQYENILYWEYVPPGEATEGSVVWLGAQPGATAQKKCSEQDSRSQGFKGSSENSLESSTPRNLESYFNEGGHMKELIERLKKMFNRAFSEDGVADEIKAMLDEKDTVIAEKEKRISELSPLAEDGRKWREDLINKYVTSKAKLGEVDETAEAQEGLKKVVSAYPIEFLVSECRHLKNRVTEKFPDTAQTKGDDRKDKTGDGGEKDYMKDNPLTPKKEGN